jgi:hypothetical protein
VKIWAWDVPVEKGRWKIVGHLDMKDDYTLPKLYTELGGEYFLSKSEDPFSADRTPVKKEEVDGLEMMGIAGHIAYEIKLRNRLISKGVLDSDTVVMSDNLKYHFDFLSDFDLSKEIQLMFFNEMERLISVKRVSASILKKYKAETLDDDDAPIVYITLAYLQIKQGAIEPGISQRAKEELRSRKLKNRLEEFDQKDRGIIKKQLDELLLKLNNQ